jgi:glycerophosphoryl diester phosphodiesterase
MLRYTVVLIFVVSIFNGIKAQPSATQIKNKYPIKVIAHRGASAHAPENTLAAVKKAIALGANYVEIDVHLSKDEKVVVIHDATLDRTTNHMGQVAFYKLEELKRFDAGAKFNEQFRGEKIPTLEEVLAITKDKAILLIEIKKGTGFYTDIEKKIFDVIKKQEAENWVEVQSFYDPVVKNWLALETNIPIHKLMVGNLFPFYIDYVLNAGSVFKRIEGATGLNPNVKWMGNRLYEKIKEKKLSCYVWTVNEEKDIKKLLQLKVNGIITNYPEKVIKMFK